MSRTHDSSALHIKDKKLGIISDMSNYHQRPGIDLTTFPSLKHFASIDSKADSETSELKGTYKGASEKLSHASELYSDGESDGEEELIRVGATIKRQPTPFSDSERSDTATSCTDRSSGGTYISGIGYESSDEEDSKIPSLEQYIEEVQKKVNISREILVSEWFQIIGSRRDKNQAFQEKYEYYKELREGTIIAIPPHDSSLESCALPISVPTLACGFKSFSLSNEATARTACAVFVTPTGTSKPVTIVSLGGESVDHDDM